MGQADGVTERWAICMSKALQLVVNLAAGQMIRSRCRFMIWPVLSCIPVFSAVSAVVPGIVIKRQETIVSSGKI